MRVENEKALASFIKNVEKYIEDREEIKNDPMRRRIVEEDKAA